MPLKSLCLSLIMLVAGGCFLDVGGLTGGARDGSVDSSSDASTPCPATEGPAQVFVAVPAPGFCIDATEVSRRQYQRFLDAKAGSTTGQRENCAWNTTFTPATWPPSESELELPVVLVDWCDADAYCAWAGKRLCGGLGGGPLALASVNDAATDTWFSACSRNGTQRYPYGDAFETASCASGGHALAGVGASADCEGGYSGLFDLSGNVREWTDACEVPSGESPATEFGCLVRGGSIEDNDLEALECRARDGGAAMEFPDLEFIDAKEPWVGFRCCGP